MEKLMRSRAKKIGGVCGGFAKYFSFDGFEADPTWIRLFWFLTSLVGGFGILAYLVCWIVIPLEPLNTDKING